MFTFLSAILLAYFHILVQQYGHMYAECNVYKTEHRWSGQDTKGQSCIMEALS